MKKRVFYVEDDETMSFLLKKVLSDADFNVTHFSNGHIALQNFTPSNFDICLLDIMLPGIDGFELTQKIRSQSTNIPILLISARSQKYDKQQGFDLNIDDYITKPFDEDELVWKMNALLRRETNNNSTSVDFIKLSDYLFDYKNLQLIHPNQVKRLTQKEADVLFALTKARNIILKRDEILKNIWGSDDYFNGRSLDVFISRLRKYLALDTKIKIETISKIGFVLKE